jgi:two-component system nitrate/nitrite response regulator NarL
VCVRAVASLTVLLADDSLPFRAGVARSIRQHDELELVAEVDSGLAAVDAIRELEPDVALLDVRMPGLDGIEVTERLRALVPPSATRIVVLSAHMDDELAQRALAAGAQAALSKNASRREICAEALRVGRS